jgi:NitT/TauT family transport system substrate-binding protein
MLSAGAAASAQPAGLVTLRVGLTPDDDVTPLIYARQSGLFAKAGLDVQIEKTPNGSTVATGVATGNFDVGKSSLVSLMNAHIKGLPIVLVAPGAVFDPKAPYTELLVPKDAQIVSGKDLNGKIVACATLRDLAQLAISSWVDLHGGDAKTLQFVEVPMSAAGPALTEHRIYAASVTEPFLDADLDGGKVVGLGSAYAAIAKHFMFAGWFATSDWAHAHAATVKTFARVMVEAARYTNGHRAETAPMMADFTGIPLAVYQHMSQRATNEVALTPGVVQPLIDAAAKYGFIPHGFPARDLIDADVLP